MSQVPATARSPSSLANCLAASDSGADFRNKPRVRNVCSCPGTHVVLAVREEAGIELEAVSYHGIGVRTSAQFTQDEVEWSRDSKILPFSSHSRRGSGSSWTDSMQRKRSRPR